MPRQVLLAALLVLAVCAAPARAVLPQQSGVLDLATPGQGAIKITGAGASWTGHSVADAGDVNGDTHPDLIIGAPRASTPALSAGHAYVVFGPVTGDIDLANLQKGFRIQGAEGTDFLGFAVAGAGDVNGDGFADVVVGAPGAGGMVSNPTGKAYVIFGKPDNIGVNVAALGNGGFSIAGPHPDANFGKSVAFVDDMSGDGKDEVVVGAPDHDSVNGANSGGAWVIFSRGPGEVATATMTAQDGLYLRGPSAGAYAGLAVAGMPDLTNDGRGEVVVGVPGAAASSGAAYTIFGTNAGGTYDMGVAPGSTYTRPGSGHTLGQSLSPTVSQDADQLADLLIGTQGEADVVGRTDGGVAYLGYGRSMPGTLDLALPNTGFQINGADGERAGQSVAGLGDVNGAGGPDFAVTAPCADRGGRTNSGSAYVLFRDPGRNSADLSNLPAQQGFRIDGAQGRAGCPASGATESDLTVAGLGDMNGDSRPDLLVGAPRNFGSGGGVTDGSAWIILGWGPGAFGYPTSASGRINVGFSPLNADVQSYTGTYSFSIDPPLPAGLSINPATGEISGTPTEARANQIYTVTMTDFAGSYTRQVELEVTNPPDTDQDGIPDAEEDVDCIRPGGGVRVPEPTDYNGCPEGLDPPFPGQDPFVYIADKVTGSRDRTNSTAVNLIINWPKGTREIRVRNGTDAAVAIYKTLQSKVDWVLSPSEQSITREVEVRFIGDGFNVGEDSIIQLDVKKPTVTQTVLLPQPKGKWLLGVRAADDATGVRSISALAGKKVLDSADVCGNDPSCSRKVQQKFVGLDKRPLSVQVTDDAGNVRPVQISGKTCTSPARKVTKTPNIFSGAACFKPRQGCKPDAWYWEGATPPLECERKKNGFVLKG